MIPRLFALALLALLVARSQVSGQKTEPLSSTSNDAMKEQWAFKPRTNPSIPVFTDPQAKAWIRQPLDGFILQKLRQANLPPGPEADRLTWMRRVTFDLTGLPPTPEEVVRFVQDTSPSAHETVVERLLQSPHYGEKWGRHWLDVVRFAESEGFEYDRLIPDIWRYRDYVVQAFNDDKPFDEFVREQIAGDEMDPKRHEYLVAAGFHRLGPVRRNAGNKLIAMSRNEVLTEMTDAIGSTFLGLTVGCARCHDHRFDKISLGDYYHLQAFLSSTHEHQVALADATQQTQWKEATARLQAEIDALKKQAANQNGASAQEAKEKIGKLKSSLPKPLPIISTVHNVADERTVIHILKRGDPERKGPVVNPRVLGLLAGPYDREVSAEMTKPRSELARWLTDPANPLTVRVWVNRVWQYHFGKGLVATPNDFGNNGARPSHPELLDFLSNTFIVGGQRTKNLHRQIVLSAAYRQSVLGSDPRLGMERDPDNRLLWKFSRRRLTAEEIRDTMLAVSGTLVPERGGPSVLLPVPDDLVQQLYDPSQWKVTTNAQQYRRRSLYLIAKRNLQLPFFQVFDQPNAQVSCPRREASTHALQALEMLNGPIAPPLADALAKRLTDEFGTDRQRLVERAFWLCLGRGPTLEESSHANRFLERQPVREFALALFNLNAYLYVD